MLEAGYCKRRQELGLDSTDDPHRCRKTREDIPFSKAEHPNLRSNHEVMDVPLEASDFALQHEKALFWNMPSC